MTKLLLVESLENKIYFIRGQKVMLDKDLSNLYGVKTKAFNQAVQRNIERFPADFMFQLSWEEVNRSRSQFVTLKKGKNIKYRSYAFTEQGVAMLSSVLKSKKAIQVNILIMRVFVKIRKLLSTHKELSQKLNELEKKTAKHDVEIKTIFEAIHQLIAIEEKPKKQIGFRIDRGE